MAYIENAFAWNCRFHVKSADTFWHTSDSNDLRNWIGRINFEIAIFYISYCIEIRIILYFGPKSVWRSPKSRVKLLRKGKFGPLFFFSKFMMTCQKYYYFNFIHFFIQTCPQLGSLAWLLMPGIKYNTTFCYVLLCYA